MNKIIISMIGALLLVSLVYVSGVVLYRGNAYEDLNDGLVLDIDLNQDNYISGTKTFADDSGEGNNGNSTNAATFATDKYGKSTGAMSFDGSSDSISLTDLDLTTASGNDEFTLSAWINTLQTDNYDGVVHLSSNVGLFLCSDGGFSIQSSGDNAGTCPSNTAIDDGLWHHIVVMYIEGTNYLGYKDGSLVFNVSTADTEGDNSATALLGQRVGGDANDYFNGSISSVKIYNRVLSADEVTQLYNDYKPKLKVSSIQKGLVGHWALDNESYNSNTERITDKTPYENHGTNNGAVLTTDQMGQSNRAMSFDGSGDYVNNGDVNELDTFSYLTVSIWFKRDVDRNDATNHGTDNVLIAQSSNAANDNLEIGTDGTTQQS